MAPKTLNQNCAEADLVCYRHKDRAIEIEPRAHQHSSPCPSCGQHSSRVHSWYRPRIAELPWAGLPAHILLQTRRFFCVDGRCSRRIFTERLPGIVERYARRSSRLRQALTWSVWHLAVALVHGWLRGFVCQRAEQRCSGPFANKAIPPRLHPRKYWGSTSGPGRRGIDTGRCFAIWRQGESLICFTRATLVRFRITGS
jgi:transposase